MNNILAISSLVIIAVSAGNSFAKLAGRQTIVEQLSLSFVLGAGGSTFLWFLLARAGMSLTPHTYILSAAIFYAIGFALVKIFRPEKGHTNTRLGFSVISLIILSLGVLTIIISSYFPITSWDALTLYDFRGIVIAQTHSLAEIGISTYYLSYPLMTSLTHAMIYMFGGSNPQTFYALLYISLIGITFGRVQERTGSSKLAILAALLIACSSYLFEHATISYTNLPYAVFFAGAVLYAPKSLILSGVLFGLSVWTRSAEPFWVAGIALVIYYAHNRKRYLEGVLAILIFLSFKIGWSTYLLAEYTNNSLTATQSSLIYNTEIFSKIWLNRSSIISYVSKFVITPHLGVWMMAIIGGWATLTQLGKKRPGSAVIEIIMFWFITSMVIGGIAIFSTYYASWYSIGGSATRMLIFLIPLIVVSSIELYHLLDETNDNK